MDFTFHEILRCFLKAHALLHPTEQVPLPREPMLYLLHYVSVIIALAVRLTVELLQVSYPLTSWTVTNTI